MPAFKQQRVTTLLHQLRYEIGVAGERTARRQPARHGPDEIDIGECACLIAGKISRFRAEQDQLLVANDRHGCARRIIDRENQVARDALHRVNVWQVCDFREDARI